MATNRPDPLGELPLEDERFTQLLGLLSPSKPLPDEALEELVSALQLAFSGVQIARMIALDSPWRQVASELDTLAELSARLLAAAESRSEIAARYGSPMVQEWLRSHLPQVTEELRSNADGFRRAYQNLEPDRRRAEDGRPSKITHCYLRSSSCLFGLLIRA